MQRKDETCEEHAKGAVVEKSSETSLLCRYLNISSFPRQTKEDGDGENSSEMNRQDEKPQIDRQRETMRSKRNRKAELS